MEHRQRVPQPVLLSGQGMRRGAAYVRVSVTDPITSVDRQQGAILDWAQRHGAEITEWFIDLTDGNEPLATRPAASQLLRRADAEFDYLVVTDWSRLTTDGGLLHEVIRPFLAVGMSVFCLRPDDLETAVAADQKGTMN